MILCAASKSGCISTLLIFFSSRRRHTRCALVTGVQTCALPICAYCTEGRAALCEPGARANAAGTLLSGARRWHGDALELHHHLGVSEIGRASCRERVCQYV